MANGVGGVRMTSLPDLLNGTSFFVSCNGNIVIVALPSGLSTAERGRRLLNLERRLRCDIDPRIEVFLRPTGDLNKLRIKLRGVKV